MSRHHTFHAAMLTLALAGFLNITSTSAVADETGTDPRDGRNLYVKFGCYQCHGYEGQGSLFTGPRIAPEPLPFAAFAEIVRRPYGSMPAYSPAVMDDQTLEAIHTYLLSISR